MTVLSGLIDVSNSVISVLLWTESVVTLLLLYMRWALGGSIGQTFHESKLILWSFLHCDQVMSQSFDIK